MKTRIIAILMLFVTITHAQKNDSKQALKKVIEDFRTSIINPTDEEKFSSLFLHDSITWAAIITRRSKEKMAKRKPNFKFFSSDYKSFYKMLGKNDEERFYNVVIDARDEFAVISFDYAFFVNSNILNWGREYWSLMQVNGEWKITSVTWSMNMQHHEKCPFASDDYFKLEE